MFFLTFPPLTIFDDQVRRSARGIILDIMDDLTMSGQVEIEFVESLLESFEQLRRKYYESAAFAVDNRKNQNPKKEHVRVEEVEVSEEKEKDDIADCVLRGHLAGSVEDVKEGRKETRNQEMQGGKKTIGPAADAGEDEDDGQDVLDEKVRNSV